jgi:hypothetical protein
MSAFTLDKQTMRDLIQTHPDFPDLKLRYPQLNRFPDGVKTSCLRILCHYLKIELIPNASWLANYNKSAEPQLPGLLENLPAPTPRNPSPISPDPDPAPIQPSQKLIDALEPHLSQTTDLTEAAKLLLTIMQGVAPKSAPLDEAKVIELVQKYSSRPATVNLTIRSPLETKTLTDKPLHYAFPLLLSALSTGVNVLLVGPAGSGKTMAAELVAIALNRKFEFTGAIDSSYKLSGFIDAQGRIIHTGFRRAYEHGGVFLFDEMDGSAPAALLAFNAALANGHADFPDGIVDRHPDFLAIGAANTFGHGASRQYVGRNQLDAASLDRFVTLDWNYDPALECAIIGLPAPINSPLPRSITPLSEEHIPYMVQDWHRTVIYYRAKVEELKLRHVVSPRATLNGIKLLAAGWTKEEALEGCVYKGMDADTRIKLGEF